jgi:sigma-E factor negative regulatory protein RseA
MKAKISALVDGELERHEADMALEALKTEGDARDTWRAYHLISDSMRDTRLLSSGFAARIAARLADEPTVLAPRPKPILEQRRWQVLSAAASLAAVAFVVSVAFSPQEGTVATPQVASQAASPPPQETAQVAPPAAADDYLLAHHGYSPRNSFQGMTAYVRTVSSGARPQAGGLPPGRQ